MDKDNRNGRALHDKAILGVCVGHSPTHSEGMLVHVPARNTVLSPSRDVVVHERALFTDGEPRLLYLIRLSLFLAKINLIGAI